jgi:D-alanyl-D-alanine-carboxypeptidase/D-alanyl-D-alanine-endopeptidase
MWVEVLSALLVEGYREFVEWLQTRPRLLRRRADGDAEPAIADVSTSPPESSAATVADAVDSVLERHARKHVGVVVGIWWNGEAWTFARGRMRADQAEAPSPTTIFEIGSVTKVFTALLLADMAAEGLVALDDPVQQYLPQHVRLPVWGRPITLVDLATQSSGLPRLPKGLLGMSLRDRGNPYAGFTERHLERAVVEARLKGPPGEKLRYSNFGFGLLGHVLARRGGADFEHIVRERICDPLGLRDTSMAVSRAAEARVAQGHNRRRKSVSPWDLPTLAGAGTLRSTVGDLLRFLELQLQEPTTSLGCAAATTHVPRMKRGPLEQCLGWVSLPLLRSPHRMLWHNGGTGGFRSFVGLVSARQLGVVVLSNSARSVDAVGFRILERLGAPSPELVGREPSVVPG